VTVLIIIQNPCHISLISDDLLISKLIGYSFLMGIRKGFLKSKIKIN
jgi:hypothetical protein